MYYTHLLNIVSFFSVVNCGVLIISPKEVDVKCLKPFDKEVFDSLTDHETHTKVVTFHLNTDKIPDDCEGLLKNKHSAYIPSVTFIPNNAIVVNQNESSICKWIQKRILSETEKNVIHLLIHARKKYKRSPENDETESKTDAEEEDETTEDDGTQTEAYTTEESATKKDIVIEERNDKLNQYREENDTANVVFNGDGKVLVYSSKRIEFIRNGIVESRYSTPRPTDPPITVDVRPTYFKLHVKQVIRDSKKIITLIFLFLKEEGGYWSLPSIEMKDNTGKGWNLTCQNNKQDIIAPFNFSWSCGGKTICSGENSSLVFYNMQVQPGTKNGTFSKAWNCVPFMTAPIWMGLMVSIMLALILALGISCIMNIKSNDKFDNRYLTITVLTGE